MKKGCRAGTCHKAYWKRAIWLMAGITFYCLLSTAAKPLPFRDHFHEFAVEAFGVIVLLQIVVQ